MGTSFSSSSPRSFSPTFSYFETEAAGLTGKEESVKGYKVRVQYQPVDESETRGDCSGHPSQPAAPEGMRVTLRKNMKESSWSKLILPGLIAALTGAIVAGLMSGLLVPWLRSEWSPEEPIRKVIEQEASLVLEGKIEEVLSLFDEDAYVRDAAGGNIEEQILWTGREEIIKRYWDLPRFVYLKHDAIEITVSSDDEYARAIADTVGEYVINGKRVEVSSNRGEKWTLRKIAGEWKITSFTYNLP